MWLDPAPLVLTLSETYRGIKYVVTATPAGAAWDFGDGSGLTFRGRSGFGAPYPTHSPVAHVYQADFRTGFAITARVVYEVKWTAIVGAFSIGPYPMGMAEVPTAPLGYPVQQAQPELLQLVP